MIVVAGEALIDLVIEPSGAVTAALGGAPFNVARACGRLGVDVEFAGAISDDRFGTMLAGQLADDGVSLERVRHVGAPTTLAAAELDDGGAATYRFYIDGTSAPSMPDPIRVANGDILFSGGLGLELEPMAAAVEASVLAAPENATVMIDVNCRPLVVDDRDVYVERVMRVVSRADVVKVSDEDLGYLSPGSTLTDAAGSLLRSGPKVVLLTAGSDAVQIIAAGGEATVRVPPVEVVDTIGAGDSFGAGFIAWWDARGYTRADVDDMHRLVEAVEAGIAVAGVVCGRRGADPPWRRELPADWSP